MGRANGVALVKVSRTEILVGSGPLQHVVTGGEDRVSNGNQGALGASQCSQSPELRLQVSPLALGGGPGSFAQRSPRPGIPPVRRAALPFASGPVVAGADACPSSPGRPQTEMLPPWDRLRRLGSRPGDVCCLERSATG